MINSLAFLFLLVEFLQKQYVQQRRRLQDQHERSVRIVSPGKEKIRKEGDAECRDEEFPEKAGY